VIPNDSIPAVVMGAILLLLGGGSAWYFWQHREPAAGTDELARRHAIRQTRRRLQISAMLILVGVLIPLGDLLPFFRRAPVAFVFFWVAVMCLAGWIALLGLADFASTRAYHSRIGRQLEQQKASLEAELARARAQRGGSRYHSDE
jgi:hypothetical protein